MACFATPFGLRYAAHCFNRADAQNNRPALIPAGGKLGVTSSRLHDVPLIANVSRGHTRDTLAHGIIRTFSCLMQLGFLTDWANRTKLHGEV